MKRCPVCRRDYYDNSLSFCLDDGTALLDGPGQADETPTAILSTADHISERETRAQIDVTEPDPDVVRRPDANNTGFSKGAGRKYYLLAIPALVIILAGAYFVYRSTGVTSSDSIDSIAVMPFVNEGADPEIEYLADGMTETLLNNLSQIPNLNVKARSSVFRYKGKEVDAQTIGKELGVQAILNGRIVQRADSLTLFLELVDAGSGNRLWGNQYNRKQNDLVLLQADIARDVSQRLRNKLSGTDEQKVVKNYTASPEAYQYYLQGRFEWNKRTEDGVRKSREYFQKAIAADPKYAMAYVGFADSFVVTNDLDPADANPKAKTAALKALELDPTLGEAYAVLGNVALYYEWDWPAAEKHYKKSIELSPNYATAYHWYGEGLAAMGRFGESFAIYERATQLDPLSMAISTDQGWAFYFARDFDRAIQHFNKLIETDPTYVRTYFYLSVVFEEKQMFPEAIASRKKGLLIEGRDVATVTNNMQRLSDAYAASGEGGYWRTTLDLVTENAKRTGEDPIPVDVAGLYSKLIDRDKAFEWLEKGFSQRGTGYIFLKVDPTWDPIRSDRRFADLLNRVGLDE